MYGGGREHFIQDDDTVGCGMGKNMVNPDQLILQFATQILDIFFLFKMRKEPVEKKEVRLSSRDWTADACQIVRLPEGTGKGGFPALVRTGDHNDALLAVQVKIIANNGRGRGCGHEFIGQRYIKP